MFLSSAFKRAILLAFVVFLLVSTLRLLAFEDGFPFPPRGRAAPTELPEVLHLQETPITPPTVDNFPNAETATSPEDLPQIPRWNQPPSSHVTDATPLFIGFTRNWRILQQVVVSYIVAGWPPEDIYVVENTGTMLSNQNGLLSLQNPFYLNYKRLTDILKVNVITTPTLLTFAQLQNFYIHTALKRGWTHYWWSHQDVVAVAMEDRGDKPYTSLYSLAVEILQELKHDDKMAMRWFSYDRLELVRTQSLVDVGGWDTMIPFYMTDIDMHERLWMANFTIENADAGRLWDVDSTLDDLSHLYHRGEGHSGRTANWSTSELNSPSFTNLLRKLDELGDAKAHREGGRNMWQGRQTGGHGEPFYRDSFGFERAIQMTMKLGGDVFYEKWGRAQGNLRAAGMVPSDAWRAVKDWERPEVQRRIREERKKAENDRLQAQALGGR